MNDANFLVFSLIAILLCNGVHGKGSEDANLLRRLLDHDINDDEAKAFDDWTTDEQIIQDKDNNDDQYDDPIDDGGTSLSDGLPENEIDNNENKDYDDDQYDDDIIDDGEISLSDGPPENEIDNVENEDYDNDYNDDDQYNDDTIDDGGASLSDDLPENEIDNVENEEKKTSKSTSKGSPEDKIPFNFEDNPDMSASDAIYQINSYSGIANSNGVIEDDIVLDESRISEVSQWEADNGISKRAAKSLNNREYRWPNRILKYRIETRGSARFRHTLAELAKAIEEYRRKTCIRFAQVRGTGPYHVRMMSGNGCYSYVGYIRGVSRQFTRSQDVSIGNGCNYKGIIVHELLHALGFWHEQSRPDRDQYVQIVWDNIQGGRSNTNFMKHSERDTADLGIEYDYESVMHYGESSFAKRRGAITIRRLRGRGPLGQRNGLSPKDANELNRYYECNGVGTPAPPTVRPTTRPTTTPPPVSGSAIHVFIKSVACRTRVRCGRVDSVIKVNNRAFPVRQQGAAVAVLNGKTGRFEGIRFERSTNIGNYLLRLQPNKLVLLTVAGKFLRADFRLFVALKKIGADFRQALSTEMSFAVIGWTGPGKVSVTEGVYGNKDEGASVISKYISFPLI